MKDFDRERIRYNKLLDEVSPENIRIAVIITGATLQELAQLVVKMNFVSLSVADERKLFEGYGPIATFSAAVDLGFAMGLFSKKVRQDLHAIRDIRNHFAHSIQDIDLDTPAIRDKVLSLNAISNVKRGDIGTARLLRMAADDLMLFMILKTSPAPYRADQELIGRLKHLDFSNFNEVKLRDAAAMRSGKAAKKANS